MQVVLKPGEYVEIKLAETDGTFRVVYGQTQVDVRADLPDSSGRSGLIYREKFGGMAKLKEKADQAASGNE
jgi:hypothetical protein